MWIRIGYGPNAGHGGKNSTAKDATTGMVVINTTADPPTNGYVFCLLSQTDKSKDEL